MLQKVLLVWVLAWTVIAFALMGIDKAKAKRHKQRIPEKMLFLSAILGGSVGSLLGMYLFRHKKSTVRNEIHRTNGPGKGKSCPRGQGTSAWGKRWPGSASPELPCR